MVSRYEVYTPSPNLLDQEFVIGHIGDSAARHCALTMNKMDPGSSEEEKYRDPVS